MHPNQPKIIPLPRDVATELVLLAVLAPVMVHDLSADYLSSVFATDATDASSRNGAYCEANVSKCVVETLWRQCKSKGSDTRLLTEPESFLQKLELFEECCEQQAAVDPGRPLAFTFDFVEIYAGSAKVTKYVSQLGASVCRL